MFRDMKQNNLNKSFGLKIMYPQKMDRELDNTMVTITKAER